LNTFLYVIYRGGAEVTDDESGLPQEYLNSPLYKQSLTQSQNPTTGGIYTYIIYTYYILYI